MITKVYSAIPEGYTSHLIEIEGDTNRGLPCFTIVGMAAKTITESRERVRSAIANSNFTFPTRKVTINLAPAALHKDGTHLDLPIAVAILVLAKQLHPADLEHCFFVGELSLTGEIRPVRGIINILEIAKKRHFQAIYLPAANLPEAMLIPNLKITPVSHLTEVFCHLKKLPLPHSLTSNVVKITQTDNTPLIASNFPSLTSDPNRPIPNLAPSKSGTPDSNPSALNPNTSNPTISTPDFSPTPPLSPSGTSTPHPPLLDQVQGQSIAKRALIIALAGHHNLLLSGPPGAGKTLLAEVAANLLPPLSPTEQIEIAKLHSLVQPPGHITISRPFRHPHHSASVSAMLGGGPYLRPGEISLAHRGILFLDEFPEFSRNIIEALRQPLEDRQITISRAKTTTSFPANFMLIATMNPCPCGHLHDPYHPCTCTPTQIQAYRKRLSGPILDRIDLILNLKPVSNQDLLSKIVVKNTQTEKNTSSNPQNTPFEHEQAKQLILTARHLQAARYSRPDQTNSILTSSEILEHLYLSSKTKSFLATATSKLNLSARNYFKILKISRTIADLASSPEVASEHIAEALSYRAPHL